MGGKAPEEDLEANEDRGTLENKPKAVGHETWSIKGNNGVLLANNIFVWKQDEEEIVIWCNNVKLSVVLFQVFMQGSDIVRGLLRSTYCNMALGRCGEASLEVIIVDQEM